MGLIAIIAIHGRTIPIKIQPLSGETLLTIEGNSLIAFNCPVTPPRFEILGTRIESPISKKIEEEKLVLASIIGLNRGLTQNEIKKFLEICFCESSFDEKAESYAGWPAGMGECGIIPNTWNYILRLNKDDSSFNLPDYCLIKFTTYDQTHPIFSKECNLLLGAFLFKKEGERHWDSSRACWDK